MPERRDVYEESTRRLTTILMMFFTQSSSAVVYIKQRATLICLFFQISPSSAHLVSSFRLHGTPKGKGQRQIFYATDFDEQSNNNIDSKAKKFPRTLLVRQGDGN